VDGSQRAAALEELRSLASRLEADARAASGPDGKRLTALVETLRGIGGG
jgi:hypothetical protein